MNTKNKNNAAGWVPSSDNRTAQSAFSQPGKGVPVPVAPNVRLATSQISTPSHMQSQKNKTLVSINIYTFFYIHNNSNLK